MATCVECDQVFNKDNIIHHLAQIHGVSVTLDGLFGQQKKKIEKDEKKTIKNEHKCDHCSLTFTTKRDLETHQRISHQVQPEKKLNFECKVCGKRFRRPYLLREHSLIHSKQTGFKCTSCDAVFRLVELTNEIV